MCVDFQGSGPVPVTNGRWWQKLLRFACNRASPGYNLRAWAMTTRPMRLASVLILACAVSYAIAAGTPADRHNADSLIPVFVSLEHWTPFFWGQDRFGMLLALIARPIRDGLWNLLVQNMLSAGLLLLGIAAALGRPVGVAVMVATTTIGLLLVWPTSSVQLLLLTTNQSYAPALGLAGLAGAMVRPGEWRLYAGAVALLCLSAWLNAGVALLVSCASVAALVFPSTRSVGFRLLCGAAVAIGFHWALQQSATDLVEVTHLTLPPAGQVVPLLDAFWTSTLSRIFGNGVWVVLAIWVIAMAMAGATERRWMLAVVAGGALYGCVMAVLFAGLDRHAAPLIPLFLVSGLAVIARMNGLARVAPAVALLIGLAIIFVAKPQTPNSLKASLLARLGGKPVTEALNHDVSIVTGDYWSVWPVTFALRYLIPDGLLSKPVFPVVLRSDPMVRAGANRFRPGAVVLVIPRGDLSWWNSSPERPHLETVPRTSYDIRIIR